MEHYCLFDTTIGPCGVAWSGRGLTRLQLPESDRRATEARLARAAILGREVPSPIGQVIADICRYMTGHKTDFSAVAIDLKGVSPFHQKVYAAARAVGWGQTATYGELAGQIGAPETARAVGQALSRNPVPLIIPCHRVLASGGRVGGFSAYGGPRTKERLLALEGVRVGSDAPLLPGI